MLFFIFFHFTISGFTALIRSLHMGVLKFIQINHTHRNIRPKVRIVLLRVSVV